jgi:hypothetical protein
MSYAGTKRFAKIFHIPFEQALVYINIGSYYPVTTLTPVGVTSSPEVTAAKRSHVTVSCDDSASSNVC